MIETQKRPGAFISYSHRDWDFTSRLEFALSVYVDVFWDKRLREGPFPPQLYEAIENNDFFIFIMTPNSLDSKWCKKELKHALKKSKRIFFIRIYKECIHPLVEKQKNNYADFAENFDEGFRSLTKNFFDTPYSPWEHIASPADDAQVIGCLRKGLFPGLIAKEVAEWVIVERLWLEIEKYISGQRAVTYYKCEPRTATGVMRRLQKLLPQLAKTTDARGIARIKKASDILEIYNNQTVRLSDTQHKILGDSAFKFIQQTQKFYELNAAAMIDAHEVMQIQSNFIFDTAEKIRELINLHARRSRYLY